MWSAGPACELNAAEFCWGKVLFAGIGGSGLTGAFGNGRSVMFSYSSSSASCVDSSAASGILSVTLQQRKIVLTVWNHMQFAGIGLVGGNLDLRNHVLILTSS